MFMIMHHQNPGFSQQSFLSCLIFRYYEAGNQNKECGIHVIPFITLLNPVRRHVVLLWPFNKRFIHSGTERVRVCIRDCADDYVLRLQEDHQKAILLEYSLNDRILSTNKVPAPLTVNDDMTVAIVIKSLIQLKEGDAKKTSETNDHENQSKQDMSKGQATKSATAFGLILRRTSI
ncbi:hypothetical protein M0R45_011095 [Rubus argutus]|uniref:Uncharacterized protein n=1 Tax=Rubus argutus TaxID=59490 RepID=A0AAW1YCQ4_RUBAR